MDKYRDLIFTDNITEINNIYNIYITYISIDNDTKEKLLSFKNTEVGSNNSSENTKEEPISNEETPPLFDIKSLNGIEDKMIRGSAKKIYMAGKRANKSSSEVVDDILNELSDKMDDKTKDLIGGLK